MASKADTHLVSQAEYARMRKARGLTGGTREGVRKAVADGRISCFGLQKMVDPKMADKQWQRNTNTRQVSLPVNAKASQQVTQARDGLEGADTYPLEVDGSAIAAQPSHPFGAMAPSGGGGEEVKPEPDGPSYHQYRMQRERAEAEISAMNAAKMRGELVQRSDIDRAGFEIGRAVRDALENVAVRIAPELAAMTTADGCFDLLRREHRQVLEQLASSFRERSKGV